jgi:hypothetical protein
VTEHDELALLDQRTRDLATAVQNLRRYEEAVEQTGGPANHEIHGSLKHEVWEAEMALHALITATNTARLAALTPDEIQQARRQAQEEAITAIAHAKGWQWEDDTQRWRTPDGAFYSRIGEPL